MRPELSPSWEQTAHWEPHSHCQLQRERERETIFKTHILRSEQLSMYKCSCCLKSKSSLFHDYQKGKTHSSTLIFHLSLSLSSLSLSLTLSCSLSGLCLSEDGYGVIQPQSSLHHWHRQLHHSNCLAGCRQSLAERQHRIWEENINQYIILANLRHYILPSNANKIYQYILLNNRYSTIYYRVMLIRYITSTPVRIPCKDSKVNVILKNGIYKT